MPRHMTKVEFTKELINQVKSYKSLYVKSFGTTIQRNQDWTRVAKSLGAGVEECKSRWTMMRRRFSKTYKIAAEEEKIQKMTFYKDMLFMMPYMRNVKRRRRDKNDQDSSNKNTNASEQFETTRHVFSDIQLIRIIQRHPALYNRKENNKTEANDAWKEVAKEMLLTEHSCKLRWKNLLAGLKKSISGKSEDYANDSRWKQMDYVLPYLSLNDNSRTGARRKRQTSEDSDESEELSTDDEDMLEGRIEFNSCLIEEVKKYPCLYVSTDSTSRSIAEEWKKVAETLHCKVEKCKSRWNYLIKRLDEVEKTSIDDAEKAKKFHCWTKMKCFIPYYQKQIPIEFEPNESECEDTDGELSKIKQERQSDIDLIDKVKPRLYLYAADRPDVDAVQKHWEEIAAELNRTVDDCKRQWSELYNEFMNKLEGAIDADSQRALRRDPFWRHLYFVRPFLKRLAVSVDSRSIETVRKKSRKDLLVDNHECGTKAETCDEGEFYYRKQFILSLLEDMRKMEAGQERFFKQKVVHLINNIFSTQKLES